MNRKKVISVASAALFLVSAASASVIETGTIPATPNEKAAFEEVERVFHFRQADSRILMRDFLNDYPSSEYRDAVMLMLADSYFYDGQYSLAFVYYSKLRDNAFSGDVQNGFLFRKAFCQIKRGFYQEASTYYTMLLGSPDYSDDAEFYLAYIEYVKAGQNKGDYNKAYRLFQNLKNKGYKGVEVDYYLNQIDYLNGDFQKVAPASDRLLLGNIPDELKTETMRVGGLSYFKLGNRAKAADLLSRYVDIAGDGAKTDAMYALGTIYYDEGKYNDALSMFSPLADYNDELEQSAQLYIGQIYLAKNEPQKAALAFDKAARLSWDSEIAETAAYNLAVTSAMGSSLPFANTVSLMENFIETYPHSPYATSLSKYLANAYYKKRDYQSALRQVEKITPQDAYTKETRQKIMYQMGLEAMKQAQYSQAVTYLSEASSASVPDKEVAAQASLWLGDAYFAQKNYAEAAKAYAAAISSGKLGENTALAYYNEGYALLRNGDYSKAETAFKTATATKGLTPQQYADARLRYADCMYYNRNYTDALALYRKIKKEGGDNAIYATIVEAEILGRQGNASEKISILEGLTETAKNTAWYNTVLTNLADTYTEQGHDSKAAVYYAMIIDNNGTNADNSDAYYALATNAENLYKIGDMAGALAAYKRMEESGIPALCQNAAIGVMRTSSSNEEIAVYSSKVLALPGISADVRNEAHFRGAQAGLALGESSRTEALASLTSLARSSDRFWGARAAVVAGEALLSENRIDEAEEILLYLIDNDSDDNYWLARAYIALADVYTAKNDEYLAKLYLETLRDNYPGSEADIKEMISNRLNNLKK